MPEATSEDHADERPCLHCMMVELIEDFYAEYQADGGEPVRIASLEGTAALLELADEIAGFGLSVAV